MWPAHSEDSIYSDNFTWFLDGIAVRTVHGSFVGYAHREMRHETFASWCAIIVDLGGLSLRWRLGVRCSRHTSDLIGQEMWLTQLVKCEYTHPSQWDASVYSHVHYKFIMSSLHSTKQIIKLASPAERWPSHTRSLHWAHQTHPKCLPQTTDNLHISMNFIVMKRHTFEFLPALQLNGLCISTLIHTYEKSDDLPLLP